MELLFVKLYLDGEKKFFKNLQRPSKFFKKKKFKIFNLLNLVTRQNVVRDKNVKIWQRP